jgi:hypothetical protein
MMRVSYLGRIEEKVKSMKKAGRFHVGKVKRVIAFCLIGMLVFLFYGTTPTRLAERVIVEICGNPDYQTCPETLYTTSEEIMAKFEKYDPYVMREGEIFMHQKENLKAFIPRGDELVSMVFIAERNSIAGPPRTLFLIVEKNSAEKFYVKIPR